MAERRQFLAQRRERIAVARRGGIGGDGQLAGDLFKGELAPDLEHQHLPLLGGQTAQRRLDRLNPFEFVNPGLKQRPRVAGSLSRLPLARGAAALAAAEVHRGPAD